MRRKTLPNQPSIPKVRPHPLHPYHDLSPADPSVGPSHTGAAGELPVLVPSPSTFSCTEQSLVKRFLSPDDPCPSLEGLASALPSSSCYLQSWQEGRGAVGVIFVNSTSPVQEVLMAAESRSTGKGNNNSFLP